MLDQRDGTGRAGGHVRGQLADVLADLLHGHAEVLLRKGGYDTIASQSADLGAHSGPLPGSLLASVDAAVAQSYQGPHSGPDLLTLLVRESRVVLGRREGAVFLFSCVGDVEDPNSPAVAEITKGFSHFTALFLATHAEEHDLQGCDCHTIPPWVGELLVGELLVGELLVGAGRYRFTPPALLPFPTWPLPIWLPLDASHALRAL